MIKINLLPYREKEKKENLSRQITIIVGSFVIFILCLVWLQIWMTSKVEEIQGQVDSAKQQLKILDQKVGDLEKFKKLKAELQLKMAVIEKLEQNRLAPVKTLDDLALLVPQRNIWLVRISQNGARMSIQGIGRDNIAVADFMKTVENFAAIQSVDLISSKKKEIAGITLQEFNFSCRLKKGF